MDKGKYDAFRNEVAKIQRENINSIKVNISDCYHFGADDKTLIWTNKDLLPVDIVLKISQAANKYLL